MKWVRIDTNFMGHPKAVKAGPRGRALFFAALLYAGMYETDGHIPEAAVALLAGQAEVPRNTADHLVAVGLWEKAEDGYMIHGFLEFNPSREAIEADRDGARKRWRNAQGRFTTSPEVSSKVDRSSDDLRENFGETSVHYVTKEKKQPIIPCYQGQADEKLEDDDDEIPEVAERNRAEAALCILADRDLADAVIAGRSIKNPAGYQRKCLENRRRDHGRRLGDLALEHPEWSAEQLADAAERPPEPESRGRLLPYTVCHRCEQGFVGEHECPGAPVRADRRAVEKSLAIGRENLRPTTPRSRPDSEPEDDGR